MTSTPRCECSANSTRVLTSRAMRRIHLVPAMTLTLLLWGCSAQSNVENARTAVDHFHSQMSSGDYGSIYDSATSVFKSAGTREQFEAFLKGVKLKMGACADATQKQWRINATTAGTFVQLSYVRKCANGDLNELFTWKMENGKTVLNGYNANIPLLR